VAHATQLQVLRAYYVYVTRLLCTAYIVQKGIYTGLDGLKRPTHCIYEVGDGNRKQSYDNIESSRNSRDS